MGSPPAVVIVVRHGARLDQADRTWHLNSPTPYDPPLTYGGWTQCRALGVRIAELLQTREHIFEATHQDEEQGNGTSSSSRMGRRGRPRRKKHRVIVHSSPFLRCVQSSIAISSGVSQFNGLNSNARNRSRQRATPRHSSSGEGSLEKDMSRLSTITDEDGDQFDRRFNFPRNISSGVKTKLRLDAWLGEWLSPEYYESITPPPDSVLMLASAKSELLHRGEPIAVEEQRPRSARPRVSSSSGLWGSPTVGNSPADSGDEQAVHETDDKLDVRRSQPRDRAASHGADESSPTSPKLHKGGSYTSRTGYTPPTPMYAISPHEPIPPGYVAHARDHCVDVDFQWDSMRSPQNWGDGGKYGEEWSSMHRRFRHGINSMVNWYRRHVESSHQLHGHLRTLHPPKRDEDDDEDTDTVVILVTHSAGCNALIGALTNQPVLIDIAMSSLTMAILRDRPLSPPPASAPNGRRHSLSQDSGLAQEYEVSLTASTDHLRPGSASSASSAPAPVDMPTALKVFAPQVVTRSNTLPIRHTPPPPARHISPSGSRTRSTSVSKMSFVPSPLNPNAGGSPSSPVLQQKTWLESHKPAPQKSWMDAHRQQPTQASNGSTASSEEAKPKPALSQSDSSSSSASGAGMWSAKPQESTPGLWQRPGEVPKSGPGSAAGQQTWQAPKPTGKPVGWLAPPKIITTNLSPSSAEHRPSGASSPKSDTRSVRFAPSVKTEEDDEYDQSLSPHSRSSDHSRDIHSQEEIDEAELEGLDETEIARLSKKPSATNIKIRELGLKRRWTMNDERNQERESSDWRMEQWMQ